MLLFLNRVLSSFFNSKISLLFIFTFNFSSSYKSLYFLDIWLYSLLYLSEYCLENGSAFLNSSAKEIPDVG